MTAPAGWYRDPYRPSGSRHWDGDYWSEHVAFHDGSVSSDPLGTAPQLAGPVVLERESLSAETVRADRRADIVQRWVIAIAVIVVGGYCSWVLVQVTN